MCDLTSPPGQSPGVTRIPSFEEVAKRLEQLPKLYFEPDGSFLWHGPAGESVWRIDGQLYDGRQAIAYIELKGNCVWGPFSELLQAFGWPQVPYSYRLVREGRLLNDQELRRLMEP